MKDLSYAFSGYRDKTGGKEVSDSSNPKAVLFVGGAAISNWDISAATSLRATFSSAAEFNADLRNWDTSRVSDLTNTFNAAKRFAATGLDLWKTSLVTTMWQTFSGASEMNIDLGKWDVAKVVSLGSAFTTALKFTGSGLSLWITTSLTTLDSTFEGASAITSIDLSKWDVSKVVTMKETFRGASKMNAQISTWDMAAVTSLHGTWYGANKFNADVSGFDVSKVRCSVRLCHLSIRVRLYSRFVCGRYDILL